MPGENKRVSGAQKLKSRPDLDLERRPEGGPKVDTPQEKARKKPYGFTESVSETEAKTRHADGVNPPGTFPVDELKRIAVAPPNLSGRPASEEEACEVNNYGGPERSNWTIAAASTIYSLFG